MSGENCRNCLYGGIQICRRFPPVNGTFLVIEEDWRTWCGEYKPQPKLEDKENNQVTINHCESKNELPKEEKEE